MDVEKIEKLEEVLSLGKDQTITNCKIKRLTAPGENYGSLMLSLDVTVKTPRGTEEVHTVAKLIPPNAFLQELFNTQVTFRNEIAFYNNIVPTLQKFQREQGMKKLIDFFPKCHGARINLTRDPSKVDSDAILLLENLKAEGYVNLDRYEGFDLETAKLILVDLAHLHAVPLALKLEKPEVFESEVRKHLYIPEFKESEEFIQKLLRVFESIDACKPYLKRVEETIRKGFKKSGPREPFATISHNDCWVNNTMVKLEDGKPVGNKLVDFQILNYSSPAKDVIFFLFSSVQNQVIVESCDYLIKFYHENFIRILTELNCDTARFTYEEFFKEVEIEAKNELSHVVFMLFVIFALPGTVKELSEIKEEDFMKNSDSTTDEHQRKLILVIREFAKRNWL